MYIRLGASKQLRENNVLRLVFIQPKAAASCELCLSVSLHPNKWPYTLTSFLVPVACASQLAPVNWRVCHATGTSRFQYSACSIRLPATGTRNWHRLLVPENWSVCMAKSSVRPQADRKPRPIANFASTTELL